ncbi:hypothetical protein OAA09_00605 [bacterium]|nr:hypothetical protein [bacterium]
MPTKIEKNKLSRLLREALGLASADTQRIVINEPPVTPVVPTPSVVGSETGNVKTVSSFETTKTMKKLGVLLAKLSEDQQNSVYKKIKKSMKSIREQVSKEEFLKKAIANLISESEKDNSWMDDVAGPSDADLEALEMGDEYAGEFEAEPVEDEEEELTKRQKGQIVKFFKDKMTHEEMAKIDLSNPEDRRRLKDGQIIKVIASQMGVGPSAVSNIVYQFMEKYGSRTNLQLRPSMRDKKKIPTRMHAATGAMVNKIADMVYDQYRMTVDRLGIYDEALPENRLDFDSQSPDELLWRNYLRLFMNRVYGDDIKSVGDLVTNWHTLSKAPHRMSALEDIAEEDVEQPMKYMYKDFELMNDKEKEALLLSTHGFNKGTKEFDDYQITSDDRGKSDISRHILADIWWNVNEVKPGDFKRDLMRAADLVSSGKHVGGQGWGGVVKKSDKAFQKEKKVAAREEKAALKAAEKEAKRKAKQK